MKIGEIRVEVSITEDGDQIQNVTTTGDMAIVTILGHLRLAEDTLLHGPEDEDDD